MKITFCTLVLGSWMLVKVIEGHSHTVYYIDLTCAYKLSKIAPDMVEQLCGTGNPFNSFDDIS